MIKNIRYKRRKKIRIIKRTIFGILILAVIITIAFYSNTQNKNEKRTEAILADDTKQQCAVDNEIQEEIAISYPTISAEYVEITSPSVKSPYIALLDADNNEIVAGRDCEIRIYPASMTKVMTLIVAVENLKSLDDTFTMTNEILDPLFREGASKAGFITGEKVSAKDLLYGLILPSGADAAVALAEMISGSEEEFANLMNEKCVEMGLKNTHFTNTSGLHNENQYTTPIEMAMILQYAMKNVDCAQVLSTYQYTTAITEQHPEGLLLTSNMFSRMYGNEAQGVTITSGKTGYTIEAKHCLVSYAQKEDKHYVVVAAGAQSKWYVIYDDFEIYKDYTPVSDSN